MVDTTYQYTIHEGGYGLNQSGFRIVLKIHHVFSPTPIRKSSLIICCDVDKNLSDTIKYSIINCCHTFSGQKYFKKCSKVGGDLVTMLNLSKSVNKKVCLLSQCYHTKMRFLLHLGFFDKNYSRKIANMKY